MITRLKICEIHTKESAFRLKHAGEKLVCSNHVMHMVFCVSMSGTTLWEYKDEYLIEPFCLAVTLTGDVLVLCRASKAVVCIATDGNRSSLVIKNMKNLNRPRALSYCNDMKKFLICDVSSETCYMCKFNAK